MGYYYLSKARVKLKIKNSLIKQFFEKCFIFYNDLEITLPDNQDFLSLIPI